MRNPPWLERQRPAGLAGALGRMLLLATALAVAGDAVADRVVRRGGPDLEGRVVSVDEESVVVRTSRGTIRVPRAEVESIDFSRGERARPPLKVEIRNVRSDDSIDVYLDQKLVIRGAREGGAWVDLTGELKDGNNPLRLRIHNERRTWGYHLEVRINGAITKLSCGMPRAGKSCRCCGKSGSEIGDIELPPIWLYADRELGLAEVLP